MLDPAVLTRLGDSALRSTEDEKFGLPELFTGLHQGIWSELTAPDININSFRRNLQREYTNHLINIFKSAPDNIPSDAISLAKTGLMNIKSGIQTTLTNNPKLDEMTKSHLEDMLSRVTAALEWKNR